jgi:hypothetical protein
MAKRGKTGEALGKYDEALKYAPNWTQRKDAREVLVAAYRLAAKANADVS